LFYTVTKEIDKIFPDHTRSQKANTPLSSWPIIRSLKTADNRPRMQCERADSAESLSRSSPDGNYLFHFFGPKISIFRAGGLQAGGPAIDLAQPDFPAWSGSGLAAISDLIGQPGQHISIFTSADPSFPNKEYFASAGFPGARPDQLLIQLAWPAPAAWPTAGERPIRKFFSYTVVS